MLPKECTPADWKGFGLHLRRVVEDLDKQGRDLGETGSGISEQRNVLAWAIGDWLLKGKEIGVKPTVLKKQVREALKGTYPGGTLDNFKTVCKAFKDFSRRRENVSFSHHLEIAKFDDLKIREDLLDRAQGFAINPISGRRTDLGKHSVRRLRAYIKEMQEAGQLPPTGSSKPKPSTIVTIKIGTSTYDRLSKLAETMSFYTRPKKGAFRVTTAPDVSHLIWWMAGMYYQKHKDEFKEMSAKRTQSLTNRTQATPLVDALPELELTTVQS